MSESKSNNTRALRSQSDKMIKEFDSKFFDDSSTEWRKNKKKLSNGMYDYACPYVFKNGRRCNKPNEHGHIKNY